MAFCHVAEIGKLTTMDQAQWQSWYSGLECKDIIKYSEFKPHLGPILIDSKIIGVFIQIFVLDENECTLNREGPSVLSITFNRHFSNILLFGITRLRLSQKRIENQLYILIFIIKKNIATTLKFWCLDSAFFCCMKQNINSLQQQILRHFLKNSLCFKNIEKNSNTLS